MLIVPSVQGATRLTRERLGQWATWVAAALLVAALVLWLSVWWRGRAASFPPVDPLPTPTTADLASAGALTLTGADVQPDVVLGFLASAAKDMGLAWVSVQVADTPPAAPGQAPRLDVWQAQVNLQGSYPAVKRWLREAVGRYPHLVLQTGRWARASGTAAVAVGGAEALDVQFQLVWLQRPAARLVAASGAADGGKAAR